ncbi:hypothetical protein OAN21_01940 [Alphaproteobacteria bacterium]|nr:hypothetical protein [Alphaproteobacteria bacterium]
MKIFLVLIAVGATFYSGQATTEESGWTPEGEYVTRLKEKTPQKGAELKKVEMESGWTEEGEYVMRPLKPTQPTAGNQEAGESR